ncbi:P-loop containing nucleoside triphosphate hydrolase protein [Desarmillaria tabescens]|uniref:P-loop containing nucleoside triphosphate hydrolase protein n=1 Tax=Armillaria tabescens TaxID=1929756 RepID=A0AA39K3T4_ARMTA|nr:P-loop containing nucleoside triphosphate hydrolase protein [Desarmillaria tabescens]KAK0452925.1 P-loop containing nucleoside triphosphate hydrolase protein [Desarmillaria tabescens]
MVVNEPRASGWPLGDDYEAKLSFSLVAPVDLQVRNLSIEVDCTQQWKARILNFGKNSSDLEARQIKGLLTNINADFPRGTLTGILGSSGSGKTTLLNVLSERMRGSNLSVQGERLHNNSTSLSSISHAYVTQTDSLLPTLTVRETLTYAASLRLPATTSRAQRAQLVDDVILELGLKDCSNTYVGDGVRRKGCSGGELRRVSLGIQLLGNPSVLFLDEPTTGLDATSAFHLVKTLKSLAQKGRTVIMTLHQPRSEAFLMLDRVMLLSQGRTLYAGASSAAITWFEGLVHPLELHVNPADYLIDVAAVDVRTVAAEEASRSRVSRLIAAWKSESAIRFPPIKQELTVSNIDKRDVHTAPVGRVILTLISRKLKTSIRDPLGMAAVWIEAVLMGLFVGIAFYHIPDSISGIRTREAVLYTSVGLQEYLIMMYEVYRLTMIDLPIFDREHGESIVGVVPWVISYRSAHAILEDIIVPLIFSAITYYMVGLAASTERFLYYFAIGLLNHYIAVTFAGFATAMTRDFAKATIIANTAFMLHTYPCGFFIQADAIPIYMRWTKWISPVFYAFTTLVYNEFKDRFFNCPDGDARTDPNCIAYRGDFIVKSLAVPDMTWTVVPICAILAVIVIYLFGQMLFLHLFKVNITMLGTKKCAEDESRHASSAPVSLTPNSVAGIDVDLTDYTLKIRPRRGRDKKILQGITSCFEAGKVNVILGPSGSGKTTLLNLMAQRLQSTLQTTYVAGGTMTLNGVPAKPEVMSTLCSYVTQDDSALLPYLTVRETLQFAAALRLPKAMSKEEKRHRADEVMLKMGLKDCRHTLIGNELLKGISGGEKRRVSIAVQVLTEPQVLMLDEPTSGLDAFTAASILDVLAQLAKEGRTIITTLHQSSSELYKRFGNVLLLAKGGRVAYSGSASEMLDYMSSVGFECPAMMNPADFALDVVSVDTREAEQEELGRAKVNELVKAFKDRQEMNDSGSPLYDKQIWPSLTHLKGYERRMLSITSALPILLKRGVLAFLRQNSLLVMRVGSVLGISIGIGLFFSPLGHDYSSVQSRVGCIQETLPLFFIGILQNVAIFPIERDFFYREYDDRIYSVEVFLTSYLLLELPFEIIACLIYSLFVSIATDLRRSVGMYFITALNGLSILNSGESLGIILNTFMTQNTGLALNVTNVLMSVALYMAGLMSLDMPAFLKSLNKLSPLGYSVRNMMPYAFRGQTFSCRDDQRLADGPCAISTGEQVLEIFNLEDVNAPLNLCAIVITTVVYRLLAYAVLKLVKTRFKIERRQ